MDERVVFGATFPLVNWEPGASVFVHGGFEAFITETSDCLNKSRCAHRHTAPPTTHLDHLSTVADCRVSSLGQGRILTLR